MGGNQLTFRLRSYLVRRAVTALVAIFFIASFGFVFLEVFPGDPTRFLLPRGWSSNGPVFQQQVFEQWGLGRPVLDRYAIYMGNVLTGNWGISITYRPGVGVWDLLLPGLAVTIGFAAVAILLAAAIGIVFGRVAARRKGRLLDTLSSSISLLGISLPVFGVSLILVLAFVLHFPIFPVQGDTSLAYSSLDLWGQIADRISHAVLPIATVVATSFGFFVLAARDAGPQEPLPPSSPSSVRSLLGLLVHKARPSVGAMGLFAGWVIGVEMLVEMWFVIPGLGLLLARAIFSFDLFVLSGIFLVLAFGLVVFVTITDVFVVLTGRALRAPEPAPQTPHYATAGEQVRRLRSVLVHPVGLVGLILVVFFAGFSSLAPIVLGPLGSALNRDTPFQPPSGRHFLGTDGLGRDVWTLVAYAGQTPLLLALFAFLLAALLGVAVVIALGHFGGRIGLVADEVTLAFLFLGWIPFLVLMSFGAVLNGWQAQTMLGIVLVAWPIPVRFVRSDVVRRYPGPETHAAPLEWRARLAAIRRILVDAAPIIVGNALLAASLAVMIESAVSFLGLSRQSMSTWGSVLRDAINSTAALQGYWWVFVPPLVFTVAASFGFGLLGRALKRGVELDEMRSPAQPKPAVFLAVPQVVHP